MHVFTLVFTFPHLQTDFLLQLSNTTPIVTCNFRKHVKGDQGASFFDSEDCSKLHLRDHLAIKVLEECLGNFSDFIVSFVNVCHFTLLCQIFNAFLTDFLLNHNGDVALHDATNSTKDRRKLLLSHAEKYSPRVTVGFKVHFRDFGSKRLHQKVMKVMTVLLVS